MYKFYLLESGDRLEDPENMNYGNIVTAVKMVDKLK